PLDLDEARKGGAFEGLRRALLDLGGPGTISAVAASGLRGRGGAGFPTAEKWRAAATAATADVVAPGFGSGHGTMARRYVVANGDPRPVRPADGRPERPDPGRRPVDPGQWPRGVRRDRLEGQSRDDPRLRPGTRRRRRRRGPGRDAASRDRRPGWQVQERRPEGDPRRRPGRREPAGGAGRHRLRVRGPPRGWR